MIQNICSQKKKVAKLDSNLLDLRLSWNPKRLYREINKKETKKTDKFKGNGSTYVFNISVARSTSS